MSYRTDYYLNIAEGGPGHAEVAGKLAERAELSAFQSRGSAKDWEPVITGSCPISWYTHQDDMKRVSKHWPGILFTLTGTGEDPGDQWTEYHMDGKVQEERPPSWTPKAFSPELLQ